MVYDYVYGDWWQRYYRDYAPGYRPHIIRQVPSQEDIDEFYRLLAAAKLYDARTKQPDCEEESKRDKLRKLAKDLGVEVAFP